MGVISPFSNVPNNPGLPADAIYLGSPTGISAYADQQTDAANSYLLTLGQLSNSLQPPVISPEFPAGPTAPPVVTSPAPEFQQVVWTAPDAPDQFTGSLTIDDLMPETFDEDPPALVFGTAPTFTELAPDAPPIDTSYTLPTLSVSLPAPPDLLSISIAPFGSLNIPEVDFELPEFTVAAPSVREYTPGELYTSGLLTALTESLQDRIENGGTGLNADVEQAIWDRGREREERAAREALDKLADEAERLGFMLPPGVYLDARLKIITETDNALRGHSREVMIKQAELEQSNVLEALKDAIAIESKQIDYSNMVEQRLFDACKYATEAGIAVYNARVQAYAAFVDAYKGKVAIYEAQVRAETARVDAYRAQVDAERAKADVNRALVDSYRVQIDAALSNIEIFKAQIGAIQAKAEIEKNKIMIFGEQVKAYGARVSAYTAGVEGYRATITAEATKQEAYKARVQAYVAQVDAQVKQIEARIAAFRGSLDANTSQWEAYKAAYQAESAKAQAIAAGNQSLATAYEAEVRGDASYNETLTKQWQVSLDQAQRVTEIGVKAAEANGQLYMTTRSLALDAAKVGAQVSAQLGAAALNAINWSQSISHSASASNSWSVSQSFSQSQSDSFSENHNYSYSV